MGLLEPKVYIFASSIMFLVAGMIIPGLFAVSAGLVHQIGAAIYLSGLYFALALCSYYFVVVILSVEIKMRD